MTRTEEAGTGSKVKARWSVVVVYEDHVARERAMGFCDQLVARFWARCEFDVGWWSFGLLNQAIAAQEAAEKAAHADLIIFAATPAGQFPAIVTAWTENWLTRRDDREGMLVGLLESETSPGGTEESKHLYLRHAAHRGDMDYLTHVPQELSRSIPDSLDSYTERADQVTSLLDDILRRQASPSGLAP